MPCHPVPQEEAMHAALGSALGDLTARLDAMRGDQDGIAFAAAFAPLAAWDAVKPFAVLR